MSIVLQRAIKWLLSVTAVFECWAGLFLIADRGEDIVFCFSGLTLTLTALLLLCSILSHSSALMALVQVFTASYQLILVILITTSLWMGMRDSFFIGVYFSTLFFFVLQSILIREIVNSVFLRREYEDIEGSHF